MNKCEKCGKPTSNPKYCSRDCANKSNTKSWSKGQTKETNKSLKKLGESVSKTRLEKGYVAWNKGLTKENDERIAKASKNMSKKKKDNLEYYKDIAIQNGKKARKKTKARWKQYRIDHAEEKAEFAYIKKEIEKLKEIEKFLTQLDKYKNEKYVFDNLNLKEKVLMFLYKKNCKQVVNKFYNDDKRNWMFIETRDTILEKTVFLKEQNTIKNSIYCIMNDIYSLPKCLTCGKEIKFEESNRHFSKYCSKTCLNLSPEIRNKMYLTKKENNTFNTSKFEKEVYEILKKEFGNVIKQYKESRYPYKCDFYIPSRDQFIELNITWTHGGIPFDSNNSTHIIKLKNWQEKSKESDFFKNAIKVWTESDVEKLNIAKKNKLNYTMIYWYQNDNDLLDQIYNNTFFDDNTLFYEISIEDLYNELEIIKNKKGNYNSGGNYNKIVLAYQQKIFFKKENELWQDDLIKEKIISNRMKYLNKKRHELNNKEILSGFKKSGIYYSYSQFNPFWIKAFIEEFNLQSIYDPCGGWGHRLLGAWNIDYIYNDSSFEIAENVRELWRNFGPNNSTKQFHIKDASSFTPHQNYEAVFTCPPYYNTEIYFGEKDSIKIYPNYKDWLNIWWRNVIIKSTKKANCKLFAFVINNKFKDNMKDICLQENLKMIREQKIGKRNKSHFNKDGNKENLLIFKKGNYNNDNKNKK